MAVVNTLAADVLSLRGADSEYHRISRFFRTKTEALSALENEEWSPEPGVLNVCIVGDEGLLIYDGSDTVVGHQLHSLDQPSRDYTDTRMATLVGDSPDSLNTLQELANALQNNPNVLNDLADRLSAIEDGYDFTGRITAPAVGNIIPFYHEEFEDFPDATEYHGAIAHAHNTGLMYYAHDGVWNKLGDGYRQDTISNSIDSVFELAGVPLGDQDLGDFNGATIASGSNIKEALQSLENVLEAIDIDTNDLSTLTGIAENVTNLGSFDGSTIDDGLAVKAALQQLETAIESIPTAETNDLGTFGGSTIPDNTNSKAALQQLEYAIENEVNNRIAVFNSLPTMVHASWDASTAGSFDFANDGIASSGVSSVTRTDVGKYRVTFTTPFASDAYTVTCGQGSTDYSGTGASPREVSVVARNAAYVDVICERSDDAVNEDNFYMSVIVMG